MSDRLKYLSAPLLHRCISRLLLFPSRHPIDPSGAVQRDLSVGGASLSLFISRSPGCNGRDPAVLHLEFSGSGSRAEKFAAKAANRWGDYPVEVWGLNYPGFGARTGPASLLSLPESALAVYDVIANQAPYPLLIIGGHSLGCAVALHVAGRRSVAGVLLLNPPPLRQLIVGHYGWWNGWLSAAALLPQIPGELDSVANAEASTAPALFFSSQKDSVAPPRYHQNVYDAYQGPKLLVPLPNAGHNQFPTMTEPANQSAYDWLWKQLATRVARPVG